MRGQWGTPAPRLEDGVRPEKTDRARRGSSLQRGPKESAGPRIRADGTVATRSRSDGPRAERSAGRKGAAGAAPRRERAAVADRTGARQARDQAAAVPARPRGRSFVSAGPETAPMRGKTEPQRIAKLLARAGIASRREIERMIEERRIAIDGVPLETPATILTSLQGVTVDGVPVRAPTAARLFRYHKPVGLLTAERDPAGRTTIYDRLPEGLPRVMPVGRLDLNTEGLLLLTTDGELKRKLELPSSKIPRTYRARAFGEISQDQLEELITGIEIEGMRYGPIDANLERRTGRNTWIEMTLTEGKNREVRRVLEHLGLQVSRLIRVRYGPFLLEDLPAGAVDEVRQNDLVEFRKGLK
nr:pseudouridine synthase [Sphingomonas parva]